MCVFRISGVLLGIICFKVNYRATWMGRMNRFFVIIYYLAPLAALPGRALSFLGQSAGERVTARVRVVALVQGPAVALLAFVKLAVAALMMDHQLEENLRCSFHS